MKLELKFNWQFIFYRIEQNISSGSRSPFIIIRISITKLYTIIRVGKRKVLYVKHVFENKIDYYG